MRVGFVGVGSHATNALYPALRPAGLELVATCATSRERAAARGREFGASAAFDDVVRLLDESEPDALLVCVPPDRYVDIVLPALERGIPVFTEKPAGATVQELRVIEDASTSSQTPVMVGYMKRFAPSYQAAAARLATEEFGRVTSLHMKFLMGPGFGSMRNYLVDNVVHPLDLLRFLGGEVDAVTAEARTLDDTRHALSLLLRFASGAVGTVHLGTTGSFFQENESIEVVGEQHSLSVSNVDTLVVRPPNGAVEVLRPTYTVPLKQNFTGDIMGFVPELEHFRRVVKEQAPCQSDISSARRTLELVEAVWEQVR